MKTQENKQYIVRVDYKTVITLKTKEALAFWLNKYPNAKVIEAA